jgi:hypothetical protein
LQTVLGVLLATGAALSLARAEDPYVLWATTVQGPGAVGVALTPTGELIVVEPRGTQSDSVQLKFDQHGSLVASNVLNGAWINGLTVDVASATFLTGNIQTNGSFDYPTVQGFFLAKYDRNNNLLWLRSESPQPPDTAHNSSGRAIAVDAQGNVYVGGNSQGATTLGSTTFGDSGWARPLFCKYDSTGQLVWAKRIEFWPSGQYDGGSLDHLALDSSGNIIIGGSLREGTADFGGITVFPGSTGHGYGGDPYIAKYNPSGELQWVQLGYGAVFATDKQGDIYLAWDWPVDGVQGLVKLNSGGQQLWSKAFSGGPAYVMGIALDAQDQPVFIGEFENPATLDGITLQPRSSGTSDFFVAKADAQGNIQWAISGGGTGSDRSGKVVCDLQSNIFFTGSVRDVTGSFGGYPLIPLPPYDGTNPTLVVAKIAQKPPLKIARSAQNVTLAWPVEATNYILEAATSLPAVSWDTVTNTPTVTTNERSVQLPPTGNARFFRLRRP